MGLFSKKEYVDPLDAAHDKVSEALDVFNVATAGLNEAIANYEIVEATAKSVIASAQQRHDEAVRARMQSANVLGKIEGLLA